jgi:hypothetical protein
MADLSIGLGEFHNFLLIVLAILLIHSFQVDVCVLFLHGGVITEQHLLTKLLKGLLVGEASLLDLLFELFNELLL